MASVFQVLPFYFVETLVVLDENENSINDNEPGLDGVIVNLLNEFNEIIATDTTSQGGGQDSGYYQIENIPPGQYSVQFIRPLFYFLSGVTLFFPQMNTKMHCITSSAKFEVSASSFLRAHYH